MPMPLGILMPMTYTHIRLLQTDADLADFRQHDEDAAPAGTLSDGEKARLDEIDAVLTQPAEACRDWEGFLFVSSSDPEIDVLSITSRGRVGQGGVNQPIYFGTFAEMRGTEASADAELADLAASEAAEDAENAQRA